MNRYRGSKQKIQIAQETPYNNATSGLIATEVQSAIDEVHGIATIAMNYQGTFAPSGGVYPIAPEQGDLYIATDYGSIGGVIYTAGDFAAYNGVAWDRWEGSAVDLTGVPVDNQVAVWTDAKTIEGGTGLTYDGIRLVAKGGGIESTSVGDSAEATGDQASAFGHNAKANANSSTSIGYNTSTTAAGAISVGALGDVSGVASVGVGWAIDIAATNATIIGQGGDGDAYGNYSVGIGHNPGCVGVNSICIGKDGDATITAPDSIAIGTSANVAHENTIAIGNCAVTTEKRAISMGYTATSGNQSVAIGDASDASGSHSVAVGNATIASDILATALGDNANATGQESVALGYLANASANQALAIGSRSIANAQMSFALGWTSTACGDQSFAIGANSIANSTQSMAIGVGSSSSGLRSSALGYQATTAVDDQIVIGRAINKTILLNGTVYVKEVASAEADIAGLGQIWVKNDTPNNLYFTDDVGTDYNITGHIASTHLDATNGADNHIATFIDADSLYGESHLTFDGTNLEVRKLGNDVGFFLETYSISSIDYSRLRIRKSNTNTHALTQTDANDYIGIIQFEGCNTTPAFAAASRIFSKQVDVAGARIPAKLYLDASSADYSLSNQLVLSNNWNTGICTENPDAALHVYGSSYTLLTGTVTATHGSDAILGAGTSFDTELFVGSAIKIASDLGAPVLYEVFTVIAIADATHLTLDSNYLGSTTPGLNTWTDGDLFKVSSGDGDQKYHIDNIGDIHTIGSFYQTERTAAAADIAGDGQLWVKDDTPNNLYWTNDIGTDYNITGHIDSITNPHSVVANQVEADYLGTPAYDDIQDWIDVTQGAGVFTGCIITENAALDGTIDISAGSGFIKVSDNAIANTKFFSISATSSFALNAGINHIYIYDVAGVPTVAKTNDASTIDLRTEIAIGRVFKNGSGHLHILGAGQQNHEMSKRLIRRIGELRGAERASGLLTTKSPHNNLSINVSAGLFYFALTRLTTNVCDTGATNAITGVDQGNKQFTVAVDLSNYLHHGDYIRVVGSTGNDGIYTVQTATYSAPTTTITVEEAIPNAIADGNIHACVFKNYYRDGGGGWTVVNGSVTIDNVNWDDNTGVLNDLTPNRYGVHWVFIDYDGHILIVYGQGDYTLAQAEDAILPNDLPDLAAYFSIPIAKIILKKNEANLDNGTITTPFEISFAKGNVINHNDLGLLQGGIADEYYHLTAAEYGVLGNAVDAANGVDNRIATFTDADSLNGEANLTFDGTKLLLTGTQYITERAAAAADVAGQGQIWVKSDAPNTLWFTDDTGVDTQLGVGGGFDPDTDAFNIGSDAVSSGASSISLGHDSDATANYSIAMGFRAQALGQEAIAIGLDSNTGSALRSVCIGASTASDSSNGVAIGYDATIAVTSNYCTAVGAYTDCSGGSSSTAIGHGAQATATFAIAIGASAAASGQGAIAIGQNTAAAGTNIVAVGNSHSVTGALGSCFGYDCTASGINCVSIGITAISSANYCIAIGNSPDATADGAIAIGGGTQAAGIYSASCGYGASGAGTNSSAYGRIANASGDNSTAVGYNARAATTGAVAIGLSAWARTGTYAVAIGPSTNATGAYSFSTAYAGSSTGVGSISMGYSADATANYAVAISRDTTASHANSVALGYKATTSTTNQIMLGGVDNNDVTVMGGLFIEERAAAHTSRAGFGQLWTKLNGTTTEFWVTEADGTHHQLAYV